MTRKRYRGSAEQASQLNGLGAPSPVRGPGFRREVGLEVGRLTTIAKA